MADQTEDARNWRDWRRMFRFSTAAIAAFAFVWSTVTWAWAKFELPAPVVLTARYERDQKILDARVTAAVWSINSFVVVMGRMQRNLTSAELREVDRQIASNQGRTEFLAVLSRQREAIISQRDETDSVLRKLSIPLNDGGR